MNPYIKVHRLFVGTKIITMQSRTQGIIQQLTKGCMGMTVNEFVCLFPRGTTFFVHMIYADENKTNRLWEHNHSVGWGADFYGITRYPVGSATVRDCQIPKLMGYDNGCDVTVYAYEEHFCENLKKLKGEKK